MLTYSLTSGSSILRSDGASIPADPLNTDYAAFLAWVAANNTPTPVPGPSLASVQSTQIAAITAACQAAIFAGFPSNALGAAHTYPAKEDATHKDQTNLASSVLSALLAVQEAVAWAPNTSYAVGTLAVANSQIFVNMAVGTSGPNAPTWPTAANTIVLDGGAQWQIWTTPFWCEDAAGNWAWIDHTASQIKQVGRDGKAAVLALMAKNQALTAQVTAATSPAAVQAINWS